MTNVSVPLDILASRYETDLNQPEVSDILRRLLDLEARAYKPNQFTRLVRYQSSGIPNALVRWIGNDAISTSVISDDGTTVQIGSAPNYISIATSGLIILHGTARVNKTIILAQGILGSGSAAPTLTKVGNSAGYKYAVNDEVYFVPFEIPYDWDETTDLLFKVHYYSTNTTASRFVKFQIDYNSTAEGAENVDAATTTTDTGDITLSTTANRLSEATKALPAAKFAQDDVVSLKVKRIASTGTAPTSPADNPVVLSFEIEYVANKLGEAT